MSGLGALLEKSQPRSSRYKRFDLLIDTRWGGAAAEEVSAADAGRDLKKLGGDLRETADVRKGSSAAVVETRSKKKGFCSFCVIS